MIVVEVGVKNLWLPLRIKNIKLEHTGVKLGAKQLNIFRVGCKTTQDFWIQNR
jgi:hypothetical protein